MKLRLKTFLSIVFALGALPLGFAQQLPVLTVSITDVAVLSNGNPPAGVAFIDITNLGLGYRDGPPGVTITGGGGSGATAVATINNSGTLSSIIITNGGTGYTSMPDIIIDPPPPPPVGSVAARATARAFVGIHFPQPIQNESYGQAGVTIAITALAVGTFPVDGFVYEYFVNGVSIGVLAAHPPAGTPATIGWTPPQPGEYFLTVTAKDGARTATSLPVRYFATGTMITSPTPNTIVPQRSSVVLEATATPRPLNAAAIGGSGYTVAPSVEVSDSSGSGAAATAMIGPAVTSIVVTNGGRDYVNAPLVTISGGGGSGATAIAAIHMGVVTGITITDPGSGYTSTPLVAISAAPAGGVTATATAMVSNRVTGITLTSGGTGYTTQPNVRLVTAVDQKGVGATAVAKVDNGAVTEISLTASNAFVQQIDFYADGEHIGTDFTAPYSIMYTPANSPAVHAIEAKAIDNNSNQVSADRVASINLFMVPPIGTPPIVSISSPADGAVLAIPGATAAPISIAVSAGGGSPAAKINKVELYIDGVLSGTDTTFPYSFTWRPTVVGTYRLIALAYDDKSNVVASSIAPDSTEITIAASPTVTLIAPLSGSTTGAGSVTTLIAAASDSNIGGQITRVQFFNGGTFIGEVTSPIVGNQYVLAWIPTKAGSASITALAFNELGLSTLSPAVGVNVNDGGGGGGGGIPIGVAPRVSLTSPADASQLVVSQPVVIAATASDEDGNIVSLRFFVNGTAVDTLSNEPFQTSWTPATEGVYRLTAVATDNTGSSTTSSEVTVFAAPVTAANSDLVYIGTYTNGAESGNFAAVNLHGTTASFIAHSTSGEVSHHYFEGLPVAPGGGFSLSAGTSSAGISGNFNETGVSGVFGTPSRTFIGPVTFSSGDSVASGYYSGSLNGRPSSTINGVVGLDGSIFLYVRDGTFADAGSGVVDASGEFQITTRSNNNFAGKLDPATRLLAGTISGTLSASFTGALPSGGSTFSNGYLRNISTRGRVGTGSDVLIAGFVVDGTVPKQLLIRAAGPAISSGFGAGVTLADPQLQVFTSAGAALPGVASNDWNAADAATMALVGASPFAVRSRDAAVVTTLNPGVYTVHVWGGDGGSGIALAEIYDVDSLQPFSSQKMSNISTRGRIGTGDNILIAGFVVNGTTPKKVLIRGVGPSLAFALPAGSTLADPVLQLLRRVPETGAFALIRENDNWDIGNDAALVREATAQVGASPAFAAGSKDAAILLVLPPGIYTAQMSGANGTSGLGLVEVYEVQ